MKSKKSSVIQNLPIVRYSITYVVLAASIILLLNLSSYVTFRSLERKYLNSNEKNVKQYIVSLEQSIKNAENNMNIMSMGESYSSYLENTRMKYADTLVCTTDLKIEDIAIRSGYNSSNTFLRAYKRYYGASPKIRKNILCSP